MSRIRTLVGALLAVTLLVLGLSASPAHAAAPTITDISPDQVINTGKIVLSITGTNFENNAKVQLFRDFGGAEVKLDVVPGTAPVTQDSQHITGARFDLTGESPGFWGVRVTTSGGQADFGEPNPPVPVQDPTGLEVLNSGAPTFTAIAPGAVDAGGTRNVTLTGTHFAKRPTIEVTDDDQVPNNMNDVTVASVTWVDFNHYTVALTVPANAGGRKETITITQADGEGEATCTCTLSINTVDPVPTVQDINAGPESAANTGPTADITIRGANFESNAQAFLERPGESIEMLATGKTVTTDGNPPVTYDTIKGKFDLTMAQPGKYGIRIANPGKSSGPVKADLFTVFANAPDITKITPTSGDQKSTVNIVIDGANFARNDTASVSPAGGFSVKNVAVESANKITATLEIAENAAAGAHDVVVTHPGDGQFSENGAQTKFNVKAGGFQFSAYPGFGGGAFIAGGNLNAISSGEAIVTGAGAGGGPHVVVWSVDSAGVQHPFASFFAYGSGFSGGVRVAVGNVNPDSPGNEVITAAGPGGGPHVKTWRVNNDGSVTELGGFFAFGNDFGGGVFVAAGNLDQTNATDEILVGAGPGGGPHVKIFDGPTLTEKRGIFVFGSTFAGGVAVAAGDVDSGVTGDEIIVGAGPGGGPHFKEINANSLADIRGQFAFGSDFRGGVNVGAGNVDNAAGDEVLVAAGPGGGPHVRALAGQTFSEVGGFFAYASSYTGGVVAAVADFDGNAPAEVVAAPQTGNPIVVGKRLV